MNTRSHFLRLLSRHQVFQVEKMARNYISAKNAAFTMKTASRLKSARHGAGSIRVAISKSQLMPRRIKNRVDTKQTLFIVSTLSTEAWLRRLNLLS